MATTQADLKSRLLEELETLPEEALTEVASFVAYQRYKLEHEKEPPPAEPSGLGGLWAGLGLGTDDLDEARREMWGNFGDRGF